MITRLLAVPAALAASAAFTVVPAQAAAPAQAANPTTIGASCANIGETGQTITRTRSYFDGSAGTWTISNYNDEPLPITRTITETKTKTWNVSAGVDFPILDLIHVTFSTSYTWLRARPRSCVPDGSSRTSVASTPSAAPITPGRPTVVSSPRAFRRSVTSPSAPATTTPPSRPDRPWDS